jgi:hypothetical protein
MSSENDNHAVLVEALEAGGYAPAAISNARVAASRGLGRRTTLDLVTAADPAAGKIAAAIFGSQAETPEQPAEMSPAQAQEAAAKWLNEGVRAGAGFGPPVGGEE